jgi:glycerol-3-phosphate dehydrogenase
MSNERLEAIGSTRFDIAVIGGGVIGAGVARDAALRGFSVALFEQRDFGSGTTSGSTRLIHGGLRYLQMLDFGLVRMDLRERETLLRIAPHLVKPLEFLIPFYSRSLFDRVKLHAGMVLYDALSYDKSLPGYRTLDAAGVLDAEPQLKPDGLQGAVCYFDAQVESPERLTVENIVDANLHGALTLNYTEVTGALTDAEGICGVTVRDVLTGATAEVRARVVINASGPWFDQVAQRFQPSAPVRIRTTKGIHIACKRLTNRGVVLFSPEDERLFFVIPLLGYGWVGTTDTDFSGNPSDVAANAEDVEYLVRAAGEYVPEINTTPMYWSNAGVRALVMQAGRESEVSRSHRIEASAGLVSILGGKITGYRSIAEEAVDAAARLFGSDAPCSTAENLLPGAVREVSRDLAEQVRRAVAEEHCVHVDDFMLRRSTLGLSLEQGVDAVEEVAKTMGAELAWDTDRVQAELERYRAYTASTRRWCTSGLRETVENTAKPL